MGNGDGKGVIETHLASKSNDGTGPYSWVIIGSLISYDL